MYTLCMSSPECQQSMCGSCHSKISCRLWWYKDKPVYITMNHGTIFIWLQSEYQKHLPSAVLLKALVYGHCQKSDADINCIECGNAWLTIIYILMPQSQPHSTVQSLSTTHTVYRSVYLRVQLQQSQTSAVCHKSTEIRSSSAWTGSVVPFMALVRMCSAAVKHLTCNRMVNYILTTNHWLITFNYSSFDRYKC